MSDDSSLASSFWFMTVLQTMGSVDMPGSGVRKMPAPRAYLATVLIWSILQLIADAGFGKAAKVSAWLVVLVGMVIGPFGKKVADLFVKVANVTAPSPSIDAPLTATPSSLRTRTGSVVRPVGQGRR